MEDVDHEKSARTFLELASEQRLAILENLRENESKLSALAKLLGATPPEVFRNLNRLEKSSFIEKKKNGNYELATYGKALLQYCLPLNSSLLMKNIFKNMALVTCHTNLFKELAR